MVFGHYLYVLWICIAVVLSGTHAEEQCAAKSKSFTVQMSPGDDIREKILNDPKIADYIKKAVKTNERLGRIKIHVGNQVEVGPYQPTNPVSTTISSNATLFQTTFPTATGTGTDTTAWTRTPVETISLETTKKTSSTINDKYNHSRLESGSCYKILATENIQTILEKNVTQGNHTSNSTAGNYTITFSNSEEKKVDEIKYTIIKFCVSWDSFADVTETDLGQVQKHVKEMFNPNGNFIGSMVPTDWDMWLFSPEHHPAWYKIYNQSQEYYWETCKQCKRNNGLLADYIIRKSNSGHWQNLLKTYNYGVSFWTGLRYYDNNGWQHIIGHGGSLSTDPLFLKYDWNGGETHEEFIELDQNAVLDTSANGSKNYFICEAVSVTTHRFQILSSKRSDEEVLKSLVDSFNSDVTISDARQIESDWDGIYIVKFHTKVAKKYMKWSDHGDYLQQEFKGDTRFIGKPLLHAWKLSSNRSFPLWYKVYNNSEGYSGDKDRCIRKGGDLPDARWIEYDWTEVIENYRNGVRFWINTASHKTLFPNRTQSDVDASHFLCTSAPLNQYCFQVLTNATKAKNILQHLEVDKSFFSEEQYEEVEIYGPYNTFKYRIHTVYTEDHFWENLKRFSKGYLEGKVLGSPVPCAWKLWSNRSFPLWYKVYNNSEGYSEDKDRCTKKGGNLPDARWIEYDWTEVIENYRNGVRFWMNTASHKTLFPNRTQSDEDASHFLCASAPLNQYCFQVLTNATNARNILQHIKFDKSFFSGEQYEEVEIRGAYNIFKYRIHTVDTEDHFWENLKRFSKWYLQGKVLGRPVPCDWSLWTHGAFVWYKKFDDSVTYYEANLTCVKYNGRLANAIVRDTGDEWKTKFQPLHSYWTNLNQACGSDILSINAALCQCCSTIDQASGDPSHACCNENKRFICESELPVERKIMKIAFHSSAWGKKSLLAQKLWEIWNDEKYLVDIMALNHAVPAGGGNNIIITFRLSLSRSHDDGFGSTLIQVLTTWLETSSDIPRDTFISEPEPTLWEMWTDHAHVWYRIFNTEETYHQAEATCKKYGARLAAKIIRSLQNLHDPWEEKFGRGVNHWIGLTRITENNFQWSDNKPYVKNETAWRPREPNGIEEKCVHIQPGGLNDFSCSETLKFICEFD